MSHSGLFDHELHFGIAFSWAAVGLAVFTALCQGLVSALTYMTESSAQWTFRFRLALIEHWWWTGVSVLLIISLGMSATAFASGRGGDPVSVLALSSATFLAMVQYMLPAWNQRHYTLTRWYAWTGDSRTAIKKEFAMYCRDYETWYRLVVHCRQRLAALNSPPSDYYGWRLWPMNSIAYDPTDIFRVLTPGDVLQIDIEPSKDVIGIYASAESAPTNASFLWGRDQNFRRRVSRAISSMPLTLLRSNPRTADGYDGRGLVMAMGILGRNKGLKPWNLVYSTDSQISSLLENSSTWTPRPSKVLRSFYQQALWTQYHGLGDPYVNAAVELALLTLDVPHHLLNTWLLNRMEHQSPVTTNMLAQLAHGTDGPEECSLALQALYESSYVAMIISLNAMNTTMNAASTSPLPALDRPELLCTGLLMKARGLPEPSWWNNEVVSSRRKDEIACLSPIVDWKSAAARLLGLQTWPLGFDDCPSLWDGKVEC